MVAHIRFGRADAARRIVQAGFIDVENFAEAGFLGKTVMGRAEYRCVDDTVTQADEPLGTTYDAWKARLLAGQP